VQPCGVDLLNTPIWWYSTRFLRIGDPHALGGQAESPELQTQIRLELAREAKSRYSPGTTSSGEIPIILRLTDNVRADHIITIEYADANFGHIIFDRFAS